MTTKNRGTQRRPTAAKLLVPTETAAIIGPEMEILSHRNTRRSIRVISPKRIGRPNDGVNTASVHDPPYHLYTDVQYPSQSSEHSSTHRSEDITPSSCIWTIPSSRRSS